MASSFASLCPGHVQHVRALD